MSRDVGDTRTYAAWVRVFVSGCAPAAELQWLRAAQLAVAEKAAAQTSDVDVVVRRTAPVVPPLGLLDSRWPRLSPNWGMSRDASRA